MLFDIDGTLVDSNYLHVEAWAHAFHDVGVDVDAWRIHRMIGLDSQKLLEEVLGDRTDELGDRAKELNKQYYFDVVDRMRPFEGARAVIADLVERGVRVALATSAPDDELKILLKVLDVDDLLTDTTSADDVETAKPEPDVVLAGMAKTKTAPADTILVGDTRWDVIAAKRAGVDCVGVLSGGVSEAELLDAGAIAVVRDVAELRETLGSGPLARLLR